MQRRGFAKSALLSVTMAAAAPVLGRTAAADPNQNVVFTENDPGHWANVAAKHVPEASFMNGTLTVKTPHPQSEAHYIVSHTVILEDGTFVGRKTFSYKEEPTSDHKLPAGYHGKVTVTSTCNLHDYWAKTISV